MEKEIRTFSVDPEQAKDLVAGKLDLSELETAEKIDLYLHW
jgi:hypothetical protein